MRPQRCRSDAGLLSTELAILLPMVLLIAIVGVYLGQVAQHGSRTQTAADAAARAAALRPHDAAAAREAALDAARPLCRGDVALHRFQPAQMDRAARPGRVEVELVCTESFGGFGVLLADPSRVAMARGVAVVEFWREAAP